MKRTCQVNPKDKQVYCIWQCGSCFKSYSYCNRTILDELETDVIQTSKRCLLILPQLVVNIVNTIDFFSLIRTVRHQIFHIRCSVIFFLVINAVHYS